jgi:hypothetical protein
MTMNRHEPFEELISASLHGDLTADERVRLDAHLDVCDQCRGTLAAFAEERRMVAGLRHIGPPRDLGARVRAGIEYASVPWWRKPATIFTAVGGTLAAVAGALLALVMLNGTPTGPQVGQPTITPTPAASTPSETTVPNATAAPATLPPVESPAPGETPAPPPTADPNATPNPIALSSPEPDLFIAMNPATPAEDQSLALVAGSTDTVVLEPVPPTDLPDPTAAAGEPIAAELSSDGEWLAYVSSDGFTGMSNLLLTRASEGRQPGDAEASAEPTPTPPAAVGATIALGTSTGTSPFLERLAWSPDSRYLAYTLADPDLSGTDVWVFDTATSEGWRLTEVGDAYAASWVEPPDSEVPALWVSRAGDTVTSYLVDVVSDDGAHVEAIDPASNARMDAPGVFQPLLSPNGALAIYWDGRMAFVDGEWIFSEGGAPYLAEHRPFDEGAELPFPSQRRLFTDLTIDRDAFTSAAIAWGVDGDSYAVWETVWTGISQDPEGTYPDPTRVYFGHATDPLGLTRGHAIDADAVPQGWAVVDVKVSPTGRHLAVMVAAPRDGLETPTAELLLITRNTDEPDDVARLGEDQGPWVGPALFDAYVDIPTEDGEAPAASPSATGSP